MTRVRRIVSAVLFGSLLVAGSATADVVVDWNAIAPQAILVNAVPVRPNPTPILDFAMVHAAMHDAIQAYQGRFETYTAPLSGATGSPVAAAATAAHDILVARFPAQASALDTTLNNYLSGHGLLANPGILTGQLAANQ